MDDALAFYAQPAPITALPFDTHASALRDLPDDPLRAGEVVRGVLIHRDWAPILGIDFPKERLDDQHTRTMRAVVERVLQLSPEPITVERPLPDHMVGVCQHFATLHVALLRNAGIPARARCGFGSYFEDGWVDHWITEWWNGERWVRTDAQLGPEATKVLNLAFDPWDQPVEAFHTAARAWQRCRNGEADPVQFGIFDLRGLFFIVGSMIQDLGALNKVELLPWDMWGTLDHGPGWEPTEAEMLHLDELAALLVRDDLTELRERFTEPDVAIGSTITSFVNGVPTPVAIDPAWLAV